MHLSRRSYSARRLLVALDVDAECLDSQKGGRECETRTKRWPACVSVSATYVVQHDEDHGEAAEPVGERGQRDVADHDCARCEDLG